MKRLTFLAMALVAVIAAQAQMIAYSVATNVVGEPGTPTVIDLQGTTGIDLSDVVFDADGNITDEKAKDLRGFPIGFDFRYNSQKMTHFLLGGDGEIQLSPTERISTEVHKNKNSWFTSSACHDIVGIALRQGFYGLEDTQISYWTEGEEGTRALCIEYKNVDFQATFSGEYEYCGAKATIQYRLYEKSGNIEMKLKGFKPADAGLYNFMRIGILGDSNDFVQVQAWDGTVYSARDNSITYSADSYPIDGTVFTFVAPEPCVAPNVAPTNLTLTSTTTQISGTFTVMQGDHFLVLATTDESLSERPADGKKYATGDMIGSAKVIANVGGSEFYGTDDMEQGTYNVFVIAYNMLCMDGPLYCTEAAKASIVMKPGAPAALMTSDIEKNTISVSTTSSGSHVIIAMTEEAARDDFGELMPYGAFGTPAGNYQVGDQIEGGGKVIYTGDTTQEPIALNNLQSGKPYFFRAWSLDGNGGYSSVYLDAVDVTAAELPWEFDTNGVPTGGKPFGWTASDNENSVWSLNALEAYFYTQVNVASEEEPTECWSQTHYLCLGENSNWLSIDIAATEVPVRWPADWTMKEGDVIAVQVSTDGVEYKDILTLNKDNMPAAVDEESGNNVNIWKMGVFNSYKVNFSEYAGQNVMVRFYIKRQSKGQVRFKDLRLDGSLYGIVGTIPGLTWDNDLIMTQSTDNKNIYTATLDVDITEEVKEPYEFKLRTNKNWEGYQLPADDSNYLWQPTEAGQFTLNFIADIAANTLELQVLRPYETSFKNEGSWNDVYAYTFSYDGENVIEYSGAWPGTKVEVSGGFFNRKWAYNFKAEQQPQYIIWSNGLSGDEAEQTDDLPFVNGKAYSYYPEITSVKIGASWNKWEGTEMEYIEYTDNAYQITVNLKEYTDEQEFKLVVNGEWIGSGELTAIEGDAADAITQGDTGSNLKLKGGTGYDIVAFWKTPGKNVKEGWLIEINENTTIGIDDVRANAARKQTVYNLKGQRLNEQLRGVNIVNGQKVVKRN